MKNVRNKNGNLSMYFLTLLGWDRFALKIAQIFLANWRHKTKKIARKAATKELSLSNSGGRWSWRIKQRFLGNLCPRSEDGVAGTRPRNTEARRGQDEVSRVTTQVHLLIFDKNYQIWRGFFFAKVYMYSNYTFFGKIPRKDVFIQNKIVRFFTNLFRIVLFLFS